jgi:hypothetical protein
MAIVTRSETATSSTTWVDVPVVGAIVPVPLANVPVSPLRVALPVGAKVLVPAARVPVPPDRALVEAASVPVAATVVVEGVRVAVRPLSVLL